MMEIETDPKKRGGETALIVEDNPTIRKMIADAFRSDGFKTCVESDNGKEGLAAAEHFKPDVIILDLSMPVMNGLDAATKLRKLFPKMPMILFSLYSSGALETVAAEAGIDLVLPKTASLSTLVERAHELMAD